MEGEYGNILLYKTADGKSQIEVTLKDNTVWLSIDQMAELFGCNKSTISRHIKSVFDSGELQADSTVAFLATVQKEKSWWIKKQFSCCIFCNNCR